MLLQDAHEGDKAAREQLVRENMGLVYAVVQRFAGRRSCEKEDLIQIGSIGLMKAIDRFDWSSDVCSSDLLKEDAVKAYRAREELERENGCEPTLEEVAARAGLTPDEVVLALEAAAEVESLNKPVGEGDGASLVLGDRLMDQRDDTETLLNRMLAGQLLHLLKEEERRLIELRYFENLTQVQTAGALGMTQVQVSRAEKRILRKMRSEIV